MFLDIVSHVFHEGEQLQSAFAELSRTRRYSRISRLQSRTKNCRMTCSDSTCCGPPQRWTASPVVILHSLEEAAARGTALVNVDMVNLV